MRKDENLTFTTSLNVDHHECRVFQLTQRLHLLEPIKVDISEIRLKKPK